MPAPCRGEAKGGRTERGKEDGLREEAKGGRAERGKEDGPREEAREERRWVAGCS